MHSEHYIQLRVVHERTVSNGNMQQSLQVKVRTLPRRADASEHTGKALNMCLRLEILQKGPQDCIAES